MPYPFFSFLVTFAFFLSMRYYMGKGGRRKELHMTNENLNTLCPLNNFTPCKREDCAFFTANDQSTIRGCSVRMFLENNRTLSSSLHALHDDIMNDIASRRK